MQESTETIGYVEAPVRTDELEYNFIDDAGNVLESHVAIEDESKARIKRAGELLAKLRAEKQIERKMLRAAIGLENIYKRKVKNRKRDKLAKAARKRNRRK